MLSVLLLLVGIDGHACSCAFDSSITDRERVNRNFVSSDLVGVFEVTDLNRTAVIGGKKSKGRFARLKSMHVFKGVRLASCGWRFLEVALVFVAVVVF